VNLLDVDPDVPIYRITAAEHLLHDAFDGRLTLTRVDGKVWLDPEENQFRKSLYRTFEGEDLSLAGLTRNMFGQCWSLRPLGTQEHWDGFGHGLPAVRICSTPRMLLGGVLNSEANPFINLQFAMGLVRYQPLEKIHAFFDDPDWLRHLQDPTGRGIMRTLLLLKTEWQEEQEVRLIFAHHPDSAWDAQNTSLVEPRIRIGFKWRHVVTGVLAGPTLKSADEKQLRAALEGN
jgi:hypothetical protein